MDVKMLIKLEEALKSIQKAYFVLEQIRDAEEEMSEDLSDNIASSLLLALLTSMVGARQKYG